MRIRWLDQAVVDLVSVRNVIAQDNPLAARKLARHIGQAVSTLADYPAAGRPGRVPNTRELVVSGSTYILPYRVQRRDSRNSAGASWRQKMARELLSVALSNRAYPKCKPIPRLLDSP